MDALTFATPLLLRKMTFANASKSDIQVMDYRKAISGLGVTHEQFGMYLHIYSTSHDQRAHHLFLYYSGSMHNAWLRLL